MEVSGDASQLLHRQHALAPRLWTMRGCPASAKTPRHPSCSGSAMPRCDCTSRWIRWYRLYRLLNGAVMHVTTTSAIAHSRMPQNAFCNPACFRTRCGETKVPWRGSHMPTQPTPTFPPPEIAVYADYSPAFPPPQVSVLPVPYRHRAPPRNVRGVRQHVFRLRASALPHVQARLLG